MTQFPSPANIVHVIVSNSTMAQIAYIAPTDRSILPFTMTMVMPIAMMPIGADCLSSSSMLSTSIKALSLTEKNSPATEKKISSRMMKPQMAPFLRNFESFPACIFCPPLRDRRHELAALGRNIKPNCKDDDDPSHDVLNGEIEPDQQEAILNEPEDQHA